MKITTRLSWTFLLIALSFHHCTTPLHAAPASGSLLQKLLVTTTLLVIHTAGKAKQAAHSPDHALLGGAALPAGVQLPDQAIQDRQSQVKEPMWELNWREQTGQALTPQGQKKRFIDGGRNLLQSANTTNLTTTTTTTTTTTSTTEEPSCEKEEEDAYNEGYAFGVGWTAFIGLGPSLCCCCLCAFFIFYCRARCLTSWLGKYKTGNKEAKNEYKGGNEANARAENIELYANEQTGQSILTVAMRNED